MATPATGDDVFEMAIGMERIGKDFYEALASGSDDAKVRAFCLRAARDEANHIVDFLRMRQRWINPANAQVAANHAGALAALAKGRIQPSPDVVAKVAIGGKLKDALEMAMRMEQDAIDFYQEILTGLFGSGELIGGIVEAEKGHLSSLRELASLERSKGV